MRDIIKNAVLKYCPKCRNEVGYPNPSKELDGAEYTRCHVCKLDIWTRTPCEHSNWSITACNDKVCLDCNIVLERDAGDTK